MIPSPPNNTVAFPSFVSEEGGVTEGGEGILPWIQQTQARVMSGIKNVSLKF